MSKEKVIFYFNFCFDEDEKTYAFLCYNVDLKGQPFDQYLEKDVYEGHFDQIEGNYGAHDWSTSPVDGINAIGYTTYEVDKSNVLTVMSEWQNALKIIFKGSSTSDVYLVNGMNNDEDIQKEVELKISGKGKS